ncbi:MAG: phosphoethanolamine transferase [Synergistaceae bacterium]|nr:phosphoethanolamine transferase [Synergistaceae bacterium]MBQ9629637.1 phosphoethanolamine transferase [Synergistaceae bacterium]
MTQRNTLIQFLSQWLESESLFIFWMIILNLTDSNVNYSLFLKDILSARAELMVLLCDTAIVSFTVIITDFVIYALFRKVKFVLTAFKAFLITLSAITFIADIFTLYSYNLPLNDIMFEIIALTNFRESFEFIQTYVMKPEIFLFFAAVVLIIYFIHRIFILIRKSKSLCAFMILCLLCTGIFAYLRELNRAGGIFRIINSMSLYRLSFLTVKYYNGINAVKKMTDEAPEVILTSDKSTIPYVVFILGESTTRNHMSLYSYELNTNPNLSGRKLYIFDDTISPHTTTALSMQKIFTFCRLDSPNEWFTYTNLFSILKSASYYTFWLSNQENASAWQVTGFYPSMCDYAEFTEKLKDDMYRGTAYDEALLPILDKTLNTKHSKNFYLIHLLGTHFHYHKRYPENFSVFSYEQEHTKLKVISDSNKEIRARYDNAVLYNDYVVNEIIRRFENKNAVVIYISDHGEEVFDEVNFLGHVGFMTRGTVEIPFMIWVSDEFSQSYPELERRIASSVHKPYMTDDMIHTLLDIMSIETPEYDPAKSIINESFDITRLRIPEGYIYDKDTGVHALQ